MYAIVDIETTGGNAQQGCIIEIAIILFDGENEVDSFVSLVNPFCAIPPYIQSLTGITPQLVASAPAFAEIAPNIYNLLSNCTFVAHNVQFDYSFIKNQLRQCGFELNVPKLCTVKLSRKAFPKLYSYSLGNLCNHLHIEIKNRHRAIGDAAATVTLFKKILDLLPQKEKLLQSVQKKHWVPLLIDSSYFEKLPQCAGVYHFKNSRQQIIYVGKADNLKKRVKSHFTNTDIGSKRQAFIRQIAHIDYKCCLNTTHALIAEAIDIQQYWPLYNRSQKKPNPVWRIIQYVDRCGYIRLGISKTGNSSITVATFDYKIEALQFLKAGVKQQLLHAKLCGINEQPLTVHEKQALVTPNLYNAQVCSFLSTVYSQLPTCAFIDDSLQENETVLVLLIITGIFWGMGFVPTMTMPTTIDELKQMLTPYKANKFINAYIKKQMAEYPEKVIYFTSAVASA